MSEQQPIRYKIVVCLIATRRYHIFVQPLIDSICKYFLLNHKIEINIFTDNIARSYFGDNRVSVVKHFIHSYGFPEATLYRYAIMTSIEYDCDYLYYLDVDYLIVNEITEEFLGNIVAVLHPGFSFVGGGSWCDNEDSIAYTLPENRIHYFAGGTQGGKYKYYYRLMKILKMDIEGDQSRNIKPEWNDEAYWNNALSELKPNQVKILDSSYCMVEQTNLQKAWKIDHLPKRIIALSKNHNEIRQ